MDRVLAWYAWVQFLALHKLGTEVHACNPSTWQVEARYWKFKNVLSYTVNLRLAWVT